MQKVTLTVIVIFFFGNVVLAQRTWSLERCIDHVQNNNTTSMRSANLEVEKNKVIHERNEAQREPELGFATSLGANVGRSLDPSTNQFGNDFTLYNSFSLEGSYTLYDGKQTQKRITQSALAVQAAQLDMEQLSKDISLQVLRAYLRILMADENLANAKKNLSQTESWLRQTRTLVNAGLQSQGDLRNVEIQKSKDEGRIIDQQNFLDQSYVALKLILEIDPSLSLKIEKPKGTPKPSEALKNLSFTNVYSKALKSQPGVEGGELYLQSLKIDEELAKAEKKPFISLFAGVGTNYSSSIRDFSKQDFSNAEFVDDLKQGFIQPDGADTVLVNFGGLQGISNPMMPYFGQIGSNIGVNAGINLYIPILDKKASKLKAEIANLNFRQKQEENIQFKQELRTEIQNAIADVQAAAAKLKATENTFALLEASIISMRNKLSVGNINAFEYKTILNEKDVAQIELVLAKYEFLLKKMIVEFYEGKELSLGKN